MASSDASWGFIPSAESPETAPSVMQSDDPSKTPFGSLFEFVATNDDTPYFCVLAAMEFRQTICGGKDRIHAYLETLANEAADVVAAALGTNVIWRNGAWSLEQETSSGVAA